MEKKTISYLYEYIKDWERDFFSWNLTGKWCHRLKAYTGNCQEEHSGVEYLNYINALGICYEMRMHAAVIDRQVIYVGYYVVRVKYLKRNDKKPEWLSYWRQVSRWQLFRSGFRSMRVVPRIIMYYSSRNAGKAFRDFLRADNDCH